MRDRPLNDYWYRFKKGARVEGIPGSATLAGFRGTVIGYDDRADAMCIVKWDKEYWGRGVNPQESVTVSLLQPLGAIEALGEVVDGRG